MMLIRSLKFCLAMPFCVFGLLMTASCDEDCVCPEDENGSGPVPSGWFAQTSPTAETLVNVHAFDANVVVAVGNAGTIIRTSDGGTTWMLVESGTTENVPGYLVH